MTRRRRAGISRLLRGRSETFSGGTYFDGIPITSLAGVYSLISSANVISVTRRDANRIPAVVASRNRLTAAITGMDLVERDTSLNLVKRTWLGQPNLHRPRALELRDTIHDMFYDGVAYWQVLERSAFGGVAGAGFPTSTKWISQERVSKDPDGTFRVDGKIVDSPEIIEFEGMHGGILHEGTPGAINDALRLARAAAIFTDSPFPLGYFTDADPAYSPEPEEIERALAGWKDARRSNGWGYVPGALKLETPATDPAKLQLADARRETVVDIARGTGADLEGLGISTTSRTYFNATQVRKDYLDFVASLYVRPIEERLSMNDVTPVGHKVAFDFDDFLRTDILSRAQVYNLGLLSGMYADENEVRAEEGKPSLTPAQKKSRAARTAPAVSATPADSGGAQPPAAKKEAP